MTKLPISVIILTYNEEKNIEECLKSIFEWANSVIIVDSFSNDKTLEIAKQYTDKIYQHPFETQAKKFNWALDNLAINTEWVMRLDADERITKELAEEICSLIPNLSSEITGLYVKRRVYFMDRWIKYGGYYPTWLLRIWRKGKAKLENKFMDEHTVLHNGTVLYLKNDIEEKNKKDLTWWINKHNNYANREVTDWINLKNNYLMDRKIKLSIFGPQEARKRWIKEKIYYKLPLFIRTFLYFFYRYIFRLGFLDGKEGLIFHFLQGFWYRFLIDAKIFELKNKEKLN